MWSYQGRVLCPEHRAVGTDPANGTATGGGFASKLRTLNLNLQAGGCPQHPGAGTGTQQVLFTELLATTFYTSHIVLKRASGDFKMHAV